MGREEKLITYKIGEERETDTILKVGKKEKLKTYKKWAGMIFLILIPI